MASRRESCQICPICPIFCLVSVICFNVLSKQTCHSGLPTPNSSASWADCRKHRSHNTARVHESRPCKDFLLAFSLRRHSVHDAAPSKMLKRSNAPRNKLTLYRCGRKCLSHFRLCKDAQRARSLAWVASAQHNELLAQPACQ